MLLCAHKTMVVSRHALVDAAAPVPVRAERRLLFFMGHVPKLYIAPTRCRSGDKSGAAWRDHLLTTNCTQWLHGVCSVSRTSPCKSPETSVPTFVRAT